MGSGRCRSVRQGGKQRNEGIETFTPCCLCVCGGVLTVQGDRADLYPTGVEVRSAAGSGQSALPGTRRDHRHSLRAMHRDRGRRLQQRRVLVWDAWPGRLPFFGALLITRCTHRAVGRPALDLSTPGAGRPKPVSALTPLGAVCAGLPAPLAPAGGDSTPPFRFANQEPQE